MSKKRSTLEKEIQRNIEADLGAEPDLLLLRNSVGAARFADDDDEGEGKEFFVPYGLGVGSPDLVGILKIRVREDDIEGFLGVWFCLEVKPPEVKKLEPDQERTHAAWRRFGAFIETVHSVDEARSALSRARRLGL